MTAEVAVISFFLQAVARAMMFCFESPGGGPFGFTGDLPESWTFKLHFRSILRPRLSSAAAGGGNGGATRCLGKHSLPRLRLVSCGRRRLCKVIAVQFHLFGIDVEEKHHRRHIVPSRLLPSHPAAYLATPSRGCDGSLAVECQAILLGNGPQGQEGALCGVHCLLFHW